jgi:hypothetical protein
MLDMNYNLEYIGQDCQSTLMYALNTYSKNPNCNSDILLKMLDMNCVPEQVSSYGKRTAIMFAFEYYGTNPNCNHSIFEKILDMNCKPEQINKYGNTALIHAFKSYGKNPNCDSKVFLKLINRLYPSITRFQLIDLLDTNTDDSILKATILGEYNYNIRNKLISARIFKRRIMGKLDCTHLF